MKDQLAANPDLEARRQIIQTAGFAFTFDEFKQAVEELAAAGGRELTPEELQKLAGGLSHWCAFHGGGGCDKGVPYW
ncbi:MAG: Nif11-like leader peptide family RiPP precursor [Syntrophales bacterium]|nr:Nif11-like leader peptide family RiPP precursor [Syntrophales bacterium]MDD5640206.1 Nif11-like leader peptide family RiPP precursor [Syntrophales bacterium]